MPNARVVAPNSRRVRPLDGRAALHVPPHFKREGGCQFWDSHPDDGLARRVPLLHLIVEHRVAGDERELRPVGARLRILKAGETLFGQAHGEREVLEGGFLRQSLDNQVDVIRKDAPRLIPHAEGEDLLRRGVVLRSRDRRFHKPGACRRRRGRTPIRRRLARGVSERPGQAEFRRRTRCRGRAAGHVRRHFKRCHLVGRLRDVPRERIVFSRLRAVIRVPNVALLAHFVIELDDALVGCRESPREPAADERHVLAKRHARLLRARVDKIRLDRGVGDAKWRDLPFDSSHLVAARVAPHEIPRRLDREEVSAIRRRVRHATRHLVGDRRRDAALLIPRPRERGPRRAVHLRVVNGHKADDDDAVRAVARFRPKSAAATAGTRISLGRLGVAIGGAAFAAATAATIAARADTVEPSTAAATRIRAGIARNVRGNAATTRTRILAASAARLASAAAATAILQCARPALAAIVAQTRSQRLVLRSAT